LAARFNAFTLLILRPALSTGSDIHDSLIFSLVYPPNSQNSHLFTLTHMFNHIKRQTPKTPLQSESNENGGASHGTSSL
jgi:hypothetical protein